MLRVTLPNPCSQSSGAAQPREGAGLAHTCGSVPGHCDRACDSVNYYIVVCYMLHYPIPVCRVPGAAQPREAGGLAHTCGSVPGHCDRACDSVECLLALPQQGREEWQACPGCRSSYGERWNKWNAGQLYTGAPKVEHYSR